MNYEEVLAEVDKIRKKYPSKKFGKIRVERRIEKELFQIVDRGWQFLADDVFEGQLLIGGIESAEEFERDLNEAIKYAKEYT